MCRTILIFAIIYLSPVLFAQTNSNSLVFTTSYTSDLNSFGAINDQISQAYISPSLSWLSKYNFDVAANGFFIFNSDTSFENLTSELDIAVGYDFFPDKDVNLYINYGHFFQQKQSSTIKSSFSDQVLMDLGYTYKLFTSTVTSSYVWGDPNDLYFLSWQNRVDYSIEKLKNNQLIMLSPGLSVNFNNQQFINQERLDFISEHSRLLRLYIFQQRRQNPDLTEEEILTDLLVEEEFTLTSVSLDLSADYLIKNYFFGISINYLIGFNVPEYIENANQFYFGASVGYIFNW